MPQDSGTPLSRRNPFPILSRSDPTSFLLANFLAPIMRSGAFICETSLTATFTPVYRTLRTHRRHGPLRSRQFPRGWTGAQRRTVHDQRKDRRFGCFVVGAKTKTLYALGARDAGAASRDFQSRSAAQWSLPHRAPPRPWRAAMRSNCRRCHRFLLQNSQMSSGTALKDKNGRRAVITSQGACRAARASVSRSHLPVGVRALIELRFAAAFQATSARSERN
jgi:hypothetical protein